MRTMSPLRSTGWWQGPLVAIGVLAALLLAWALIFQPELADQIIALSAILLTLSLIFFDPFTAFLVWLFFIPFAPFLRLDLHMPAGIPDLSYARMVGSILAVVEAARVALGKKKLMVPTFFELTLPFFILPLLWAAVRAYFGWLWGLQAVFDAFLMPLLAYFIARQLIQEPEDFRKLARVLTAIAVVVAVAAMVEQTTGFAPFRIGTGAKFYGRDIRKVGSFFANPAYVGLTLAIIAPLALMLALEARTWRQRGLYGTALFILEAGVVATLNRSAMLGALVGLLVFSLLNRRLLRVTLVVLLVVGILVGVSWNTWQDSPVGQRLTAESPIDYRLTALRIGLNIHKTAPYWGVGWHWFGRLAADRGFRDNGIHVLPSTHNSYLNFLVSGGYALLGGYLVMLAGLALTLGVVGWPRRQGRRFFPLYIQAAWASFVAYVIPIAFFDNAFSLYANLAFFTIMGGAIAATFAGGSFSDLARSSEQTS